MLAHPTTIKRLPKPIRLLVHVSRSPDENPCFETAESTEITEGKKSVSISFISLRSLRSLRLGFLKKGFQTDF